MMPPMTDNDQLLAALVEEKGVFGRMSPGSTRGDRFDVSTTDRAAGTEMTDYLLERGHRRIAVIAGHPEHLAMAERLEGVRDSLREHVELECELHVQPGLNTFESGLTAAKALFAMTPCPSAIFAANDDMAAGVLFESQELGLRVPDDISVAGFDDTLLAGHIWPGLTTIHQPITEMGEAAAQALIEGIKGREIDTVKGIPTRIVKRRSTGPAPSMPGNSP
jgi:LacI family transcriptional regulator